MTTLADKLLPNCGAQAGRPAALPAWEGSRRQGLRSSPLPRLPVAPGDQGAHCRCGIESLQRLGRQRWKAERTTAWLAGYRRVRIRCDRDSERFFAFAMLTCDRLCYNRLPCAITARLP